MGNFVIACDLGTGGNKAALFDADGVSRAETMVPYRTNYPRPDFHEQRPDDWFDAVTESIGALLAEVPAARADVAAISLSGHSLGCLPLDAAGNALQDQTPIWSDGRAQEQARALFSRFDETEWYMRTGNGFPPPLYPAFKAMWLRENEPSMFSRARHFVGSKDYVNFRLTGTLATDHSYASGSGVYDLVAGAYDTRLLDAFGLAGELFPTPMQSSEIIGTLRTPLAAELGLGTNVRVVAGGVDNSCMALGARNTSEGSVYASLGSSSWLTVTASRPVLDAAARPFVFAHVLPGYFNSALSTFSSGTSLGWVRDMLNPEWEFETFFDLAATAPPGANGLLFVPSLAGGTMLEGGPTTRGGFLGLDLSHTRADLARATLEGIAFGLRLALDRLRALTPVGHEMIAVGGGAQNSFWRQIYADVFGISVVKTSIDKNAAALGAAALGLIATGLWDDATPLAGLHVEQGRADPDPERQQFYDALLPAYRLAAGAAADLGHLDTPIGRPTP
jgi:xylulokinase